jgi:hypothetical protein
VTTASVVRFSRFFLLSFRSFFGFVLCLSEMETVVYVRYDVFADPSPAQVRGRPKYSNYQNFKGRKSSSLMNLYGKTPILIQVQTLDVLSCWSLGMVSLLQTYFLLLFF